jgi:hypothetical protein
VNSEDPLGRGGLDDSHNDLVSRPESNKGQADEDNDTQKNNSSEEEVCGICLESKIETYGLLTGCDHLFCIACISAWRNEANPISDTRSEVHAKRGCPTCRQHSNFVVPSRHFVTGQEKDQLIKEKLEIKKKIPCRDWTKDKRCKSVFPSPPSLPLHHLLMSVGLGVTVTMLILMRMVRTVSRDKEKEKRRSIENLKE